jgi:hypothetical protein
MIFKKIRLSSSQASVISSEDPAASAAKAVSPAANSIGLSRWQTVYTSFFLLAWLSLFAGGITMDTTKYRCAISTGGASRLAMEAQPGDLAAKDACKDFESWVPVGAGVFEGEAANVYRVAVAWVGVLLFFLPLNLAVLAAAAGALGALGNKANLEDDPAEPDPRIKRDINENRSRKSQDNSSPVMSGLLRGIFVYLFFVSGLLLFDDKPFSSPGPGQYIRLAGFISLISFLVNYQPHLFTTISEWAFERINARKVVPTKARREEAETEIVVEEKAEPAKPSAGPTPAISKPASNGGGEGNTPAPARVHFEN